MEFEKPIAGPPKASMLLFGLEIIYAFSVFAVKTERGF
jgi:hypothetical protein